MPEGSYHFDDMDQNVSTDTISDINVTPLVDVMLVLLIIFMVAAPLMTVGVPLQLPKMADAPKITKQKETIILSIDEKGQLFFNSEELLPETVHGRLTELAAKDKDQVIFLRGDKGVPYGRIVEIMGQISAAGFSKVSLMAHSSHETTSR